MKETLTRTNEVVSVSRRIAAPADELFGLIADPARHTGFDGSGMLRGCEPDAAISGVGDVFTMKMHNEEMGDYEIANHVVCYEPNSHIGWEPVLSSASREEDVADIGIRLGHRWSFELKPDNPDATAVTEIFDCSRAPDWLRVAVDNGNRWLESMTITLQKLDEQSTAGGQESASTGGDRPI